MFDIAEQDPRLDKATYEAAEAVLRTDLLSMQYDLLKTADRSVLVVVAGIDGAGKGATVNLMHEWMDPRHIRTLAFGAPSADESTRPAMWRYWNGLPATGHVGIVFGSWYRSLLLESRRKTPDYDTMQALVASALRFEAMLAAERVQIVKLWFHLSRKAQSERTERLLADPDTAWQVTPDDIKVRKRFDRVRAGGLWTLAATHTAHAPWIVIPSACDRLRSVRTAEAVRAALRSPLPVVAGNTQVDDQVPARGARRSVQKTDVLSRLDYTQSLDSATYAQQLAHWQGRLARAVRGQGLGGRSLILAFEGHDAAGKGGAIRRVTAALDARQYAIAQISAPTPDELAHPYLWRFWRRVPIHGRIALFDRSWYGRVLAERVEKLIGPAQWQRAYGEINDFESQLTSSGAVVLKFWLAITKEEQLKRFRERERVPFKNFKITEDDWRNRRKWNDYNDAVCDMFERTTTPDAPWHVIAANDKRHARVAVLRTIALALEAPNQAAGRGQDVTP